MTTPRMPDRISLVAWLRSTDVVALSALIVLTLAFGKDFSKLGSGGIFATEVAMVAVATAVIARLGARRGALAVERLPLTPLLAFWALGAFAAGRGLANYGLTKVEYDIGMFEYSALVLLVALVVDSRERLRFVLNAFACGCIAGILLSAMDRWLSDGIWPVPGPTPSGLLTLMISFYFAWVVARLSQRVPTARFHVPVLLLGLLLLHLDERRTAWLAILLLIPVMALFVHRRSVLQMAALGIAVFVTAGVVAQFAPTGTLGPAKQSAAAAQQSNGGGAPPARQQSIGRELSGTFGGSDQTEQGANANWRLDFWRFALRRSFQNPAGVGFGRPMEFRWGGRRYDFRANNPTDQENVSGPHNDFVHFAYRMGWPALIAVFALIGIAVARVVPWLKKPARGTESAAAAVALVSMLLVSIVFASLNDALKTPYLGIFFWILLGLLFVFPWLAPQPSAAALDGAHVEVPADPPLERAGNGRRRDPAPAGKHT
jgi:O-antigen ligase